MLRSVKLARVNVAKKQRKQAKKLADSIVKKNILLTDA